MTRQSIRWFLGLCTWLVLAGMAPTRAQTTLEPNWPARVGRLVEVQGSAWFYDRDEGSWTQAQHNRPVTTGDRISTDASSRVEIRIGSTTVRLAGDTDVALTQLDDQSIAVELLAGSLALRVTSRDVLSQIEVATAEGRFLPRATGHYRVDRRADSSEGTAWRGALDFEERDSRLPIKAGQRAELWVQGPDQTTHYRWLEIERDDFAGWVARDDHDLDRSESARYVSPEMTGWEDLDRYGRWRSHPEYGSVWMPSEVVVGWAPYRDGRWVWISPWGWTWVDVAPWGFAPFHYGRWVQWGGRWVWAPGPRVTRPVYAPALVSWTFASLPPGAHRPPPPSAWVPLAPRQVFRPHPHIPPYVPPPRDRAVPPPPPRPDRRLPRPVVRPPQVIAPPVQPPPVQPPPAMPAPQVQTPPVEPPRRHLPPQPRPPTAPPPTTAPVIGGAAGQAPPAAAPVVVPPGAAVPPDRERRHPPGGGPRPPGTHTGRPVAPAPAPAPRQSPAPVTAPAPVQPPPAVVAPRVPPPAAQPRPDASPPAAARRVRPEPEEDGRKRIPERKLEARDRQLQQ